MYSWNCKRGESWRASSKNDVRILMSYEDGVRNDCCLVCQLGLGPRQRAASRKAQIGKAVVTKFAQSTIFSRLGCRSHPQEAPVVCSYAKDCFKHAYLRKDAI